MSSGGVPPGPDPSVRAEVVHSSERTRVTRLFLPGRTVIRKQPLGPDADRRVRHEASMLERLRGIEGLAQLADDSRYPGSVVLDDAGGANLAEPSPPLAVADLIGLGLGLGRAVTAMHRRGVMHRDITPANIVVSGDGTPTLVDFALASSLAEIRPEVTHHAWVVGTLEYLAPEQTGRTGRLVDHRADLYALGATLYELATGEPPFGSGDPLQLVLDHLARVPVPPAEVNSAIPGLLSAIIMHLLEKEPDNRYQTAGGLVHDLERLRRTQAHPAAAVLRVGRQDVPLRLPGETATLAEMHTARHAALYSMGHFDEADAEYRRIEKLDITAAEHTSATAVQVISLTHRKRFTEAIKLGLDSLGECGITVPAADRLPAELDGQLAQLYRWLDHTEAADDLARPDITEPALLGASRLINAVLPAAYFAADHASSAWLALEALRIWLEHGPGPTLVGPASNAAVTVVALRGDYAAGYRVLRRILAVAEARGYEPGTSQARLLSALACWWFEPVENCVKAGQQARERLIAEGELADAGYTYHTAGAVLDCARTLGGFLAEVEQGLDFARRTGNEETSQSLESYRWLAGVLRGESSATAEVVRLDPGNPLALLFTHVNHAIAAVIFGDTAGLARHAAASMPLLSAVPENYVAGAAHLLRGLSLAGQARTADSDERGGMLAELDDATRWLAERAADAPDNFLHLLRLLEAERAWAAGDFRAAALAFDAARREASGRQRPWHQALIAERAAGFYLAHGLDQAGYDLLAQARHEYATWGATAKAEQLDWAYPAPPSSADAAGYDAGRLGDRPLRRFAITSGTIDLAGIVSALQALSSETSIDRLHARVVQVLTAMTGATGVHLLMWDDDRQGWLRTTPSGGGVPVGGTGHEAEAPMSVLRYAQRMREPLVVADVSRDDRFARDPYFADVTGCSLLAVPVLSQGTLRAVLLLENRLLRGAFTAERLDAVTFIAGQLAVSLDNAQLYAEFRRIAGEQAALRRVATLVAQGARPEQVFAAVAEEGGRLLAADFAVLVRYDGPREAITIIGTWTSTGAPAPTPVGDQLPLGGQNVTTLVYRTGQPARIDYDDAISGAIGQVATHDWGLRSSVGVPISIEGRLWGVMVVAFTREELLPADTEARLAGFTELVATAVANAQAQGELAASRARIVAADDAARRRVQRNLHDGAQQRLVTLSLGLEEAQAAVPPGADELAQRLEGAVTEVAGVLGELQEIARGLHPAVLTDSGLRPALRALVRRSGVPVSLDVQVKGRLPEPVEVAAYYAVAEALTNIAKYAGASAAEVEATAREGVLEVWVRDDGRGGADFGRGSGLAGLKDRIEALGGRISLHSPPGAGTTVQIALPLSGPTGSAWEG